MTPTLRLATLLVATLSILLASCASDESNDVASLASQEQASEPTETVDETVPTEAPQIDRGDVAITVSDQESDGETVTIDEVIALEARAFVVIHADQDGAPGEVLGHAEVPFEGPTTDIEVTLEEPLEEGETLLWAMVHEDNEPIGVYQFPGNDVPATANDSVVMQAFQVEVG